MGVPRPAEQQIYVRPLEGMTPMFGPTDRDPGIPIAPPIHPSNLPLPSTPPLLPTINSSLNDLLMSPGDVGADVTWISVTPLNTDGHFGDLYDGSHRTEGKVALKRLRIGGTEVERETANRHYRREAAMWHGFKHSRILRCIGTFLRDGQLYFVSPFMENGALRDWLQRGIDVDRPRLICEIADALVYLHALGIVHGDIKANNIMLTDDLHALLCDFGLTKFAESSTTTTLKGAGSVRWQSPELWENEPKTFKSDVYAFGMTIVEVLTGDIPFPDIVQNSAVIKAVLLSDKRPPKVPQWSPTGAPWSRVWDVAERCWPSTPDQRLAVSEAFLYLSDQSVMIPPMSGVEDIRYTYWARALYDYVASPDYPDEISFREGDVLYIADISEDWWWAKKADGSTGNAPSNFLRII